jgi:dTDP-4-amino-4,6-dideoxygalactose transaminase
MSNVLAIKGGSKIITTGTSPYIWPKITDKTREAVLKQLSESATSVYDRYHIIKILEDRLSKYYGTKHALVTSSGTSSLHSLYFACNLKPTDEVILPAYTFFATVTPILFTGATPIFADSSHNGNIDPKEINEKITDKTKAIVITHMWGNPCDMNAIVKIAKDRNLMLFEDGSHAFGARYNNKLVGTFGDAAVISMQAQKLLTGIEGGFMLTNNDELFYRAILFGQYNKKCKDELPQNYALYKYYVTGAGLNLRINPLGAAMANEQLDEMEILLYNKRKIAKFMLSKFKTLKGISVPKVDEQASPSWYAFMLQYKPEELDYLDIHKFYEALMAEGCVELDRPKSTCPMNYHPLFQSPEGLFPNYKGKFSYKLGDFPNAEYFHEHSLKLPVWYEIDDLQTADLYFEAFKKVIDNHQELLAGA